MSQAQPSEEKKWWYTSRPFKTNSLKEGAVWLIDLLLNTDSVNNDHFWAMAW
jgi:hypothetical protein